MSAELRIRFICFVDRRDYFSASGASGGATRSSDEHPSEACKANGGVLFSLVSLSFSGPFCFCDLGRGEGGAAV
jgi:hypothetical protein